MTVRSIVVVSMAAIAAWGCGGRSTPPPYGPPPGYAAPGGSGAPTGGGSAGQSVTRQTWCSSLAQSYCRHCAGRDAPQCLDQFAPACMANHAPNEELAGVTAYDTQQCGTALEASDCAEVARGTLPYACRPAPQVVASQNVTVTAWCETVGRGYCRRCMAADLNECLAQLVPNCVAGRDPNLVTDRNGAELQECAGQIEQSACTQVVPGNLPPACRPRAR